MGETKKNLKEEIGVVKLLGIRKITKEEKDNHTYIHVTWRDVLRKAVLLLKMCLLFFVGLGAFLFRTVVALVIFYILLKDFGGVNRIWVLYGFMWVCYPYMKPTIDNELNRLNELWKEK